MKLQASAMRARCKWYGLVWTKLPSRAQAVPVSEHPQRKIIAFHQDQYGDWVADLECGHTQHVRHNPPWQNRPWVVTPEGRSAYLGRELRCKKCAEEISFGMSAG